MKSWTATNISVAIGAGIITSAVGAITAWKLLKYYRNYQFRQVGVVSGLFIHPIKSCRGIEVSVAECTKLGLKSGIMRDRVFMVVTEDGTFVTARQEAKMLLIVPSFNTQETELWVDAPNMQTLKIELKQLENRPFAKYKVWGIDANGVDCGNEANQWFQTYLGKPGYQLVYFRQDLEPKSSKKKDRLKDLVSEEDATAYADWAPYLIMAEGSVADLNTRLDCPVGIRNFRGNIVVSDCEPYSEDLWDKMIIGDAHFRNTKPCQRCLLTTIDPDTATTNKEIQPLATLRKYRKNKDPKMAKYVGESALLGLNCFVDVEGIVKIGDPIFANIKN